MVIAVIEEVKNSDASTDINDSIEDINDFLVTVSAATVVNSFDLSSAEIVKLFMISMIPDRFVQSLSP